MNRRTYSTFKATLVMNIKEMVSERGNAAELR